MNQDQVMSFLRTILKMAGVYAVAHGVGDDSMWQGFAGVVLALAGVIWSHYTHSTAVKSAKPNNPPAGGAAVAMAAMLTIAATVVLSGCSTNQTTTAYKGEVGTDIAIKSAMTGWGVYVQMYHPGTNEELQVLHAFNSVRAAELTVVDATGSLANDPTNTAPLTAAEGAFAASENDLVTLIGALTNSVPKQ